MKVLIVTDQLINKESEKVFCIENVRDIIKRFSELGELSICAVQYAGKASNVLESCINEFVEEKKCYFLHKTYLKTNDESKKIIAACVKENDLIIGYVPCINAYTALKFAKKYNKKFMSYVVGCPWDAFWNHGLLGKCIAPYGFLSLRKCLKQSDYALYVTNHFLQKRYPCDGLTCGCSDVRIPHMDEDVLDERLNCLKHFSSHDKVKIATIANYSVKYKGQHFVIKALAKLKKLGFNHFHYYLIGGGDKSRLETLAKKLNVSELVHFEGIVPHSRIFGKLDEMHVCIQPSLQEGLPRSVVEAMNRGLTCICANTAAMPEMVEAEYVVSRKSVDDIVKVLKDLTVEKMIVQAKRNFEESKRYEEVVLNAKRNLFFDLVKQDIAKYA